MKYGIYYAYWEKEWGGDFIPYISKVKRLGFDILEVACGNLHNETDEFCKALSKEARANNVILTGGYGPRAEHNLASDDSAVVDNAFAFYANIFRKMELANIHTLGGAIYSYWPVEFSKPIDKQADTARSAENMRKLADMAAEHGISLNMEALNRFEGYMINTCDEAIDYVRTVDKPNVKVMLDTFHMNVEEDSICDAICSAGDLLGHFHVGEANRRPPRQEGRIPWGNIGQALRDIGYDGYVVMEPFVTMGGQVGKDISIWRDLSNGASTEELDADVGRSAAFLRELWG